MSLKTETLPTIEDARVVKLPRISDPRGNLTFLEQERHVPFEIKRVYYLYDLRSGERRGGHAHRELEQLIIAIAGSFDVILDDGSRRRGFPLSRADQGLLVPRMVWREMENFSSGSVCLVLSSDYYDESDYYRDYSDFVKAVGDIRGHDLVRTRRA